MYEHLTEEQRLDLMRLQRKTIRTMSDEERARLQKYQAAQPVQFMTPEGQQVVEEYDGPNAYGLARNPYIGLWVTYYSRPGEGRDAKTRFPAMVMGVQGLDPSTDRYKVHLAVHYNARESTDVICMQRTEADRFGTWDYVDDPMWLLINNVNQRLLALEALFKNTSPVGNQLSEDRKPPRPR